MKMAPIGYISKTHGVKGEIVLQLHKEVAAFFKPKADTLFIGDANENIPYFINKYSHHQAKVILELRDINTLEKGQSLKGKKVYLPEAWLSKFIQQSISLSQLEGYALVEKNIGFNTTVVGTIEYPNNPLIVASLQGKEILIPYNKNIVQSIDHEKKIISLSLPEGYLDIYLTSSHTKDDGD
ncbi:MAG: ribosome maturation factor RimM [Cytophagales bacterium]|nr:ribosome maturation factor RimM [Cytophagales bacterium]